jgi:hypothetical protein
MDTVYVVDQTPQLSAALTTELDGSETTRHLPVPLASAAG